MYMVLMIDQANRSGALCSVMHYHVTVAMLKRRNNGILTSCPPWTCTYSYVKVLLIVTAFQLGLVTWSCKASIFAKKIHLIRNIPGTLVKCKKVLLIELLIQVLI